VVFTVFTSPGQLRYMEVSGGGLDVFDDSPEKEFFPPPNEDAIASTDSDDVIQIEVTGDNTETVFAPGDSNVTLTIGTTAGVARFGMHVRNNVASGGSVTVDDMMPF
jgi:hypothetical protein